MDFLTSDSIAGQNLLRLVSRGSSIVAELQRLSSLIPTAVEYAGYLEEDKVLAGTVVERDPRCPKYRPVLVDFRYLKEPERFDRAMNTSAELTELDEEFYEAHEEVLARFYQLFESMYTYLGDYIKYIRELEEGYYIQHTLEAVLLDTDGRQLLCEGLYLAGVMLLMLDKRVPGCVRERLIVAHYRHKGEGSAATIVQIREFFRDSGFRSTAPPQKRPPNYPEEYLARFKVPEKIVSMILGRLRSDDIYGRSRIYPAAEDRGSALSMQAPLIYVSLYFSPRTLHDNKVGMREVVDKHFGDTWVVPLYMGEFVDLSIEWERYKAAREALAMDCLTIPHVKSLVVTHKGAMDGAFKALSGVLVEGVLSEAYVVENVGALQALIRTANVSLRWVLLHRRGGKKAWRDLVVGPGGFGEERPILDLLLKTSQLEYKLKAHLRHLLSVKAARWGEDRGFTVGVLKELGEYFSGARALTRVERDENLQGWFTRLAGEVGALEYTDGVMAGRKMRQLVLALDDVLQFDVIDATPQVKDYLTLAKVRIGEMVKSVNISEQTLDDVNQLTDFSYAWELIQDFTPEMHARIKADPEAVRPLRATVLKLTSILDVPLIRIAQAGSPDRDSVAQFYSHELVGFLRRVMGVIPTIVFQILREVIELQSNRMVAIPVKLEALNLKDLAQVEQRHLLARRTHEISIFTEGVLAMEATDMGVIKVDPRAILTDGIRKHIVDNLSRAFHTCLAFDMSSGGRGGKDPKASFTSALGRLREDLASFRRAFEYAQDYMRVYGLRMWQEEMGRVVGFACEQESNRFLRRKVLPEASPFNARAPLLPNLLRPPPGDVTSPAFTLNFAGRTAEALCALTRPGYAHYGAGPLGGVWVEAASGRELAGPSEFLMLVQGVGVGGVRGLDRLLGLSVERSLWRLLKDYGEELRKGAEKELLTLGEYLSPYSSASPSFIPRLAGFAAPGGKGVPRKGLIACGEGLLFVGHAQLLRRALALQLRFSCRLESSFLSGAVETLNGGVLGDLVRHYNRPAAHALPGDGNPLLPATAEYCEAVGINDPLTNVYLTPDAALQPMAGLWLTSLCVALAPSLVWSRPLGNLVKRGGGEKAAAAGGGWAALSSRDGGITQTLAYPMEACLDGPPLVAGIVTLLKQLAPSVTDDFVGAMGQHIRSHIAATTGAAVTSGDKKDAAALAKAPPTVSPDVYALTVLLVQVGKVGHIPDRVIHGAIPPYLLTALPS